MHYLKNPFVLAILGGILVGVAIALNFMLRDSDLIEPHISEVIVQQPSQAQTDPEITTEPAAKTVSPPQPVEVEIVAKSESESVIQTVQENTESIVLSKNNIIEAPIDDAPIDEAPIDEAPTSTLTETSQDVTNLQQQTSIEDPVIDQSISPSFDVVRITVDGHAVIAGKAENDANVKVLLDKQLLGGVDADKHGEWVFVPSNPLEPGTHTLSLRSSNSKGFIVASDQTVLINVPMRDSIEEDQSFAVVLSEDPAKPTQILQKPGDTTPSLLSIDAIDYNKNGKISITGTAKSNVLVNVYLDNTYIGTSQTTGSGQWFHQPETRIKPGQYSLRADQVDDKGAVIERIQMPFVRDELKPNANPENYYVVQPGNSLWRIARGTYGEGMSYTVIYMANKDQIGNPDLIFPGQIFSLPED